MAAEKIVYDYEAMESAAQKIDDIKARYISANDTFQQAFETAVKEWQGDSKEKVLGFISNSVNIYLGQNIPDVVNALAVLIRENGNQMRSSDEQIADGIPNSMT